jgi:hypothetical protein
MCGGWRRPRLQRKDPENIPTGWLPGERVARCEQGEDTLLGYNN